MPEEPSTLFPSLYGSEPGTNPDMPSPPTNQPLVDPNNPIPDYPAHSSHLPEAARQHEPSPVVVEGAPAPTGVPAQDTLKPRRRTAEERIGQLTKRWRQAEDGRSQLELQLQNTVNQLLENQRKLENLVANRGTIATHPGTGAESGVDSTTGLPIGHSQFTPAPVTKDDIRSVVTDVIGGITAEQQRRQAELNRLQQEQNHSFEEAAEEFPELADGRSRARKIFNELYNTTPMGRMPDGPYQIALQVRGILADEAQHARVQEGNKVAASVVTPRPGVGVDLPESQKLNAQKTYTDLMKTMRSRTLDFNEYKALRQARDIIRGR